ncbi:hypothetical protein [Dysgonomonas gadei]|uniref:Uncharacterized protein n=1 Tax=Dysgonomonas gadei ATCC BAA-286 TaxID=742766 RepID=F5IX07_9BACT|nr:hypothetical protein [Dysgonomonas gadei]EGK02354.1 hypothetical protein HMPREF9455_01624 [Dysgonomonas gadei ATCC BAA-286]
MKSKKALSAASYPSRIFKNDVTIKCPDCMVLCSGGCLTVAANSKNKETTTSLFFSRRQRSKVIFRVTQKALRDFLTYFRKYLALAGGCDHAEDKSGTLRIYLLLQNTLPMVACSEVTWQPADFAPDGRKKSGLQAQTPLHLPVVACVTSRSDAKRHLIVFHNMK